MKHLKAISVTALFFALALVSPADGRQEPQEKPKQQEEPPKPEKRPAPEKQDEPKPAKQEPQVKPPKQQEPAPQPEKSKQDKATQQQEQQKQDKASKQEQQVTKAQQQQQREGQQQQQDASAKQKQQQAQVPENPQRPAASSHVPERTAQAQAQQRAQPAVRLTARGSGRIPDDHFRSSFGREHAFRVGNPVLVDGYSRFRYGGYWFGFVEPWPADWYYTDEVYIDYVDGAYYMYNPYYPGSRFAITVVI